jgi:hypothetical protein
MTSHMDRDSLPVPRVLCNVLPKIENDQPVSQIITRLASTGIPRARARVLNGLGPLANGMVNISGMGFAKVAIPAQIPL